MHINDHPESAKKLFAEHAVASFPNECEDLEIAGVDLEELNGTIIGCVAPFVGRSGYHVIHQSELRRCREELDTVLPDSMVTLKSTTPGFGHSSILYLSRAGSRER